MATETAFTIGILQIMLLWIWYTNISFGPIFNSPMYIPRSGIIKGVLITLPEHEKRMLGVPLHLSLIPLRQSLSLNLELGWQSVRSGTYMTIPCSLHRCWGFELNSSCLHIKNSYSASSLGPTMLILLIFLMSRHAVFSQPLNHVTIPSQKL